VGARLHPSGPEERQCNRHPGLLMDVTATKAAEQKVERRAAELSCAEQHG